jgi:hypothetical protein
MNKKQNKRLLITKEEFQFILEIAIIKMQESENLKEIEKDEKKGQHEKFSDILKMLGGADSEGRDLWSMSDWLSGI